MNENNGTKDSKLPVLFVVFNRPDQTRTVFQAIRQYAPKQLFVAADGPRQNRPSDLAGCAEVRKLVKNVDWDCEVKYLLRDTNLGCKRAVSSAIDWYFKNVEAGIILEDDCLPDKSFFRYCEEMIDKYRADDKIMMISGNNFQGAGRVARDSYYFSRYTHIWGWASWRRAWKHYDVSMRAWPDLRKKRWLQELFNDEKMVRYWTKIFNAVHAGKIDTWDYQWLFTSWLHNGLTVLPNVNLVSNIGFGVNSTHTLQVDRFANLPAKELSFPLKHPAKIERDALADQYTESIMYQDQSVNIVFRSIRKIHKIWVALGK